MDKDYGYFTNSSLKTELRKENEMCDPEKMCFDSLIQFQEVKFGCSSPIGRQMNPKNQNWIQRIDFVFFLVKIVKNP